ncbi:unnamed protein product [Cuscuta epithymum]|uniref:Uncharacterized protein n=1 Tax=Cuscuta epithymum TaxID=186058 RepID=A0AAV0GB92_9ASTE|nr:unnamed protein product [Cuscuta epithymum]
MARDRTTTPDREGGTPSNRDLKSSKSRNVDDSDSHSSSDSESDCENGSKRSDVRRHSKKSKRKRSRSSKKRARDDEDSYSSSSTDSGSDSYSSESTEGEEERRRRRRERKSRDGDEKGKDRKRKREKESERRRKRRKEKEREQRKKDEKRRKKKKKDKKREKDRGKTSAVTDSWGKYGIIRETDMWNKRPEFTAWLSEIKQVNLEALPNWEEKQLFKEFMEDHNTATFPSKKYYDLDAYYQSQMQKELKKGPKAVDTERTVFNDEEQRRQELLREREKQKEEQLHALKQTMQSGMAQAMKEQAQLKEEMAYQYKLGNFEAAAAIQRRLDPDVAM